MNITPNSFSDGGELSSTDSLRLKLDSMGPIEILDLGAESTAPKNSPIGHQEEWARFESILPFLKELKIPLSIDTYHPETIEAFVRLWKDEKKTETLIWNDVSGKFDQDVRTFLKENRFFYYVLCHNLAPERSLTSSHMKYLSSSLGNLYLEEVAEHFRPHANHPRVVFDPTFGFSKDDEQNWCLLERFAELQGKVLHPLWLIGFSRKSFLRKKYGLDKITPENREELDRHHVEELKRNLKCAHGEIWVRTHRPELISVNPL